MRVIKVRSLIPVRLDKYLMDQFPTLGPGRLNKALRENKIKLNGKKQPLATRVQNGDEIRLFILDDVLDGADGKGAVSGARCPAQPVYEDEQLLIVNKPAGLPSQGPSDEDNLESRVALCHAQNGGKGPAPQLCHRLDTGTSGLVVLARTPEAEALMGQLIRDHKMRKSYVCVTFGRPRPEAASLEGYLVKDAAKGMVYIQQDNVPGARPVRTDYKTLAISGRLALLQVELITGRTHQIRAHLASIGCPILGDSKYGNNAANRELKLKYQALCAYELRFPDLHGTPLEAVSGKVLHCEKPWYYRQILDGTLK